MKFNHALKCAALFIATMLCVSCTESGTTDPEEEPNTEQTTPDTEEEEEENKTPTTSTISSFSAWCGSTEYVASVYSFSKTINISNIPNADEITKIECGCDEGVVITPTFEEMMGNWKSSNSFTVTSDKETLTYTLKITQTQTPRIESLTIVIDSKSYTGVINQDDKTIYVDCGSSSFLEASAVRYTLGSGSRLSDESTELLNGTLSTTNTIEVILGITSYTYTLTLTEPVITPLTGDIMFKVYLNDRQQQIDFMGGDIERSQSFMQQAADPQEVADLCFKDVNFSVCRVAYDKNQELVEGVKNYEFYDDAILSMKDIREAYPYVEFWATMRSDYDGYGDDSNLPDWICSYPTSSTYFYKGKYAAFLADYLELMYDNGVAISYLSTAKEWVSYVTADRTVTIIEKLQVECDERGIPMPKIIDPASWSIKSGVSFINSIISYGETDLFYGFATHDYWSSDSYTFADFATAASNAGKPAYGDEMNCGSSGPTSGEESTTFDKVLIAYKARFEIYEAGFKGELFFEPFSRGYSGETRCLYFNSGESPKIMRAYYVLKEWVNSIVVQNTTGENLVVGFNPQNKYRVTSEIVSSDMSNTYIIAFANDSEMVFWLMNDNNSASLEDMVLEVDGIDEFPSSVNMRRFDLSSDKPGVWSEGLQCVGNTISLDDVPSESLSVIYVPLL